MAGYGAGDLKHRVAFAKRAVQTDDGYGNVEGAFVEHYVVSAGFRPKFGGEQVDAARLSGIQPYSVTVRSSPEMREVTPEWRMRHACDGFCGVPEGVEFNIRGITNPDQKSQWLEMLVESGVASG